MRLKVGDTVTVIFAINHLFSFQNGIQIHHCEIIHTPVGEGDQLTFDYQGNIFAVNPNSSLYIGMEKEDKELPF